jgi:hypothetical protein
MYLDPETDNITQIALGSYILALAPSEYVDELPPTSLEQAQCLLAAATALAERNRLSDWNNPEVEVHQERANAAYDALDRHLAALCAASYDDSSNIPC